MNALSNYKMTEYKKERKITPRQISVDENGLKTDGTAPAERRRVITPEELIVSRRCFEAIQKLIEKRELRISKFLDTYGINRGNFNTLRKNPEKRALPVYLLAILVEKYNVDGNWLLSGQGRMFRKNEVESKN